MLSKVAPRLRAAGRSFHASAKSEAKVRPTFKPEFVVGGGSLLLVPRDPFAQKAPQAGLFCTFD